MATPSKDGKTFETHENVHMQIRHGKVVSIVPNKGVVPFNNSDDVFDAKGALITPGFVDPHTHLFPATDRSNEFAMRSVKSYKEIAAAGGGILSSVRSVRNSTVADLVNANIPVMQQFFAQGTTTVEVKSGYGLSLKDEMKQLQAISELRKLFKDKLTIIPTFLGAHSVPTEYKANPQQYIDLICNEMIPAIAKSNLATYCDVFCEEGYFNSKASEQILSCAQKHGLKVRLHADEFVDSGGAELAAKLHAHSADHLMAVSDAGIKSMADHNVIPIILPGTTVFLGKVFNIYLCCISYCIVF